LIVGAERLAERVDGHCERGCPTTSRELPDRSSDNGHQIVLIGKQIGHPVYGVTGESSQCEPSDRIGEQRLPLIHF